jgi:hypothetical protein
MKSFIELINGFYDLGIPNQLDPASSFLFITLLRKFNLTKNKANGEYFPDSLPIYNNELCHLTGMENRSLRNARQRLIDYRLIDDDDTTWIIRYEQRGTKESGIYSINYELLYQFDYGKFGNGYYPNDEIVDNSVDNSDDYGKFGNGKCKDALENEPIEENLVTNLSVMGAEETSGKTIPDKGKIENGKFLAFKRNETKLNTTTFPYMGTEPISEKIENEKKEGMLLSQKEEKKNDIVQVLEDTTLRWVNKLFGPDHCQKYPDDSNRREIARIKERGCSSVTIKNTVLHWKQEIKYPSKLDEFVLNSLIAQMEKGKAFYD